MATYRDRAAAGAVLAGRLTGYAGRADVAVLGLVRGGVPVAAAVAARLGAALDVLVVRKLGVPGAPEVAFGAIGPGGVLVRNEEIAARLSAADIEAVCHREDAERRRREQQYRGGLPAPDLAGATAVIVDDGMATGATARAAVLVARAMSAARVVVAVPVGAPDAVVRVGRIADEVVCPLAPRGFRAVSRYYRSFRQVSDAEVRELLGAGG